MQSESVCAGSWLACKICCDSEWRLGWNSQTLESPGRPLLVCPWEAVVGGCVVRSLFQEDTSGVRPHQEQLQGEQVAVGSLLWERGPRGEDGLWGEDFTRG